MEVLENIEALARIGAGEIESLTRAATDATFYGIPLTEEQIAANRRPTAISTEQCNDAARSADRYFAAAFLDGRFAGYVISTCHAPDSRELDWLMVHPDFHGTPISAALMDAGMTWLGCDKPMWLNVLQHNRRAIHFYERFGFVIDPDARTAHLVPHYIMRRAAA